MQDNSAPKQQLVATGDAASHASKPSSTSAASGSGGALGAVADSRGAKRKLTETEHADLAAYACDANNLGLVRTRVSSEAHEWMRAQLRSLQASEGMSPTDLPYGNEWFHLQRVEAIKQDLLTRTHSTDVVKSYLKSYIRGLKKEGDRAPTPSLQLGDVG